MDIRGFCSREFAMFTGLVISFVILSGVAGILKIFFPDNALMALLGIGSILGLWAYLFDYMLKHLRDRNPSFLGYQALYFGLATLVIGGFALFLDPGPYAHYVDDLPDAILASARAFCSGSEDILKGYSAWHLISTAEAIIGYSLIALIFGTVIQQGLPRLGVEAAKPPRKKRKRSKAKAKASS